MEVLLLQDIPGVGKKSDLIVVGDGFALNFLLPRRAALVATPIVRKRYADLIRRRAEEREKEKAAKQGVVTAVSGKTITFSKKVTKTGKLYAAISEDAIVEALKTQLAVEVKTDDLNAKEPIKAVGAFQITVQIGDQTVPVTVKVEEEKASA